MKISEDIIVVKIEEDNLCIFLWKPVDTYAISYNNMTIFYDTIKQIKEDLKELKTGKTKRDKLFFKILSLVVKYDGSRSNG